MQGREFDGGCVLPGGGVGGPEARRSAKGALRLLGVLERWLMGLQRRDCGIIDGIHYLGVLLPVSEEGDESMTMPMPQPLLILGESHDASRNCADVHDLCFSMLPEAFRDGVDVALERPTYLAAVREFENQFENMSLLSDNSPTPLNAMAIGAPMDTVCGGAWLCSSGGTIGSHGTRVHFCDPRSHITTHGPAELASDRRGQAEVVESIWQMMDAVDRSVKESEKLCPHAMCTPWGRCCDQFHNQVRRELMGFMLALGEPDAERRKRGIRSANFHAAFETVGFARLACASPDRLSAVCCGYKHAWNITCRAARVRPCKNSPCRWSMHRVLSFWSGEDSPVDVAGLLEQVRVSKEKYGG
jgi:hypothetical protein